jgi:hypothetical protein
LPTDPATVQCALDMLVTNCLERKLPISKISD